MEFKKQKFVIEQGSYPFDIRIYIGYSQDQVVSDIEKNHKDLTDEEKEALKRSGTARCTMLESMVTIIQFKEQYSTFNEFMGIITHELFHAVEFLFLRISINHSQETSEAYAYHLGFLVESFMNKAKLK